MSRKTKSFQSREGTERSGRVSPVSWWKHVISLLCLFWSFVPQLIVLSSLADKIYSL